MNSLAPVGAEASGRLCVHVLLVLGFQRWLFQTGTAKIQDSKCPSTRLVFALMDCSVYCM